MRTIVHLSDLHFNRVDEALLTPLRDCLHSLSPHLVVVSGDLTQRARSAEFSAARDYLNSLPGPQLIVPGNHDVPLYNIFARFLQPFKKYARYINPDFNPVFVDDEIAVVGLNSARSLVIKDGRINRDQVEHVREHFRGLSATHLKIVVTHHPFELPPAFPTGKKLNKDEIINRATKAMKTFAELGTDILLSGHLHMSNVTDTDARYPNPDFAALVVQAGTATSTRARGEANSFNVLQLSTNEIRVQRYFWDSATSHFLVDADDRFQREGERWVNRIAPNLPASDF